MNTIPQGSGTTDSRGGVSFNSTSLRSSFRNSKVDELLKLVLQINAYWPFIGFDKAGLCNRTRLLISSCICAHDKFKRGRYIWPTALIGSALLWVKLWHPLSVSQRLTYSEMRKG